MEKKRKISLKPESFALASSDCRHPTVLDLLDENGFKFLKILKDAPGFKNLNFLTYFRLKQPLEGFRERIPRLRLTGKIPLDYVSCVSEAFERITKGSSYYRRTLLYKRPKSTITYKSKLEKWFGITLK